MNIYTVSFFGHRYIERGIEIENRLDKLLHDLIMQKDYIDFLIGRDGEFDFFQNARDDVQDNRNESERGNQNEKFRARLVLGVFKAVFLLEFFALLKIAEQEHAPALKDSHLLQRLKVAFCPFCKFRALIYKRSRIECAVKKMRTSARLFIFDR